MEIFGDDREVRSTIYEDGKVTDKNGKTIGFINIDGSTGDENENFVGEINEDGQIADASGTLVGTVDMGTAEMKTRNGSHFCTVQPGGDLYDNVDAYRGHVDNFTFHSLKILTSYLFFFDPHLIDPSQPSKVFSAPENEPEQPPEQHVSTDLTLPPLKPAEEETLPNVSLTLPPAKPAVRKSSVEDRQYKEYKVSDFKTISGGKQNLLEIYYCDCPPAQLSVRLEKEGKQVVFQRTIQTNNNRKQQAQRFTVPYVLEPSRVEAKYDMKREDGTLSLLLTKPDPTASVGGSVSGGVTSGQFTKYIVQAVPGSQNKVTIKAEKAKTCFCFQATGEPKCETEVVGELLDGDQLKFHATITDLEAGVKKKATQSFTLPAKVTIDHIEVTDGGRCVKVHDQKQATTATGSVVSAASLTGTTQPDVDIRIIVV